MHFYEIILGFS